MIRLAVIFTICASNVFAFGPFDPPQQFVLRTEKPELGYRLPNETVPLRYDIQLTTHIHLNDPENPKTFEFEGKVGILIKVVQPRWAVITLHLRSLTINSASLRDESPSGRLIQQWEDDTQLKFDPKYEFVSFEIDEKYRQDQVVYLEINYNGTLRETKGFFRASYTTKEGATSWLAATQFEQTDARHAFPCYDEPGHRVPFGLTIIHGKDYFALSNMPVKERNVNEDYTMTIFEDTPNMPTYLLAFVISDFTHVSSQSDPPQRVFARPEAITNGDADFALRAGVDILKTIDEYFGVNYTENHVKLDQIAVPNLGAGAMENWGLVTYSEDYLLWNSNRTIFQKHEVAETIAHEYTHMLFGDLVGIKWWDQLWLKEGFATLYGKLALEADYSELDAEDLFFLHKYRVAMNDDELGTARPMNYYVESPKDIGSLYDNIAYSKGACVLRMIQHAITDEVWRVGLNYYITNMTGKAATSNDLALHLERATQEHGIFIGDVTMKEIIDNWAVLPGFPLVIVESSYFEDYELWLRVREFVISPKAAETFRYWPPIKGYWALPIHVSSATTPVSTQKEAHRWHFVTERLLSAPAYRFNTTTDWIILNPNATGYYRVLYEPILWKRITDKLNTGEYETEIHHRTRAKLIDDAFVLARAERQNYSSVFDLVQYMKYERHFLPWVTADPEFLYLDRLLTDTAIHAPFRDFVKDLITPLYREKGIYDLGSTETMGDKLARSTAVAWACRNGDLTCLKEANERVSEAIANRNTDIEPNLREVLYCAGIRQASEDDFVALWKRMQDSTDGVERRNLISALGCTENVEQQNIYLNSTVESGTTYRQGERDRVFQAVYTGSSKGVMTAIDFLGNRTGAIDNLYGGLMFNRVAQLARYVSSNSSIEYFRTTLDKIEKDGFLTGDEKKYTLAIAQINNDWLIANEEELKMYFNSSSSTAVKVATTLLSFLAIALYLIR